MSRLDALLAMVSDEEPDAFTAYAIALEYTQRREFPNAFEWFERAIGIDPFYAAAYHQFGIARNESGDPDGAITILRKGMEVARQKGDFHAMDEMEAVLETL